MFFTPPNLSDKAAYEFMEFLQDFILTLESHYGHQLRRYIKTLDEEHKLLFENEKSGEGNLF